MTKKTTRNSVLTDSRMIGATVHMLDAMRSPDYADVNSLLVWIETRASRW